MPAGNTHLPWILTTWRPAPTVSLRSMGGNHLTSQCEHMAPIATRFVSVTVLTLCRNEHYRRSPNCPFFLLIDQYQQAPAKKTTKAKGARTSKASRLSTQSVSTVISEAPSTLEQPAENDDSVLTTTSVMTAGGTKRGKAKKATTAKGKKTKSKKDEPVEVLEDPPEEEEIPPPPPPKPTRGRKRASDSVEDSVLTNAEAPAPKKRATRAPRGKAADISVVEPQQDQDMAEVETAPATKTKGKKARTSTAKNARKLSSASVVSTSTVQNEDLPEDEELDRQLQADMDRPLSDDEGIAADSDSERKKAPAKTKGKKTTKKSAAASKEPMSEDHAMFDVTPLEIDDAEISAELQELSEKVAAEEQETLEVPKKGRKAGTRKASKQTKTKKAEQAAAVPEPKPEPEIEPAAEHDTMVEDAPSRVPEPAEQHDISVASNATVLKSSTTVAPAPKKRGRPKKNSTQAQAVAAVPVVEETKPEPVPELAQEADYADPLEKSATPPRASLTKKGPKKKSLPPPPAPDDELQAPATPRPMISPAPAARQPAISPSQSPQASDAENEPPSSKPSNTANSSRIAPLPVAATPGRSSPSKRNANVLSGLQSNQPWTPADIDLIFENLERDNALPASNLRKGVQLTSPEQRMTVEEWIYHNAELAEQQLKAECEAMVSKFESEGGRAMRSLEELVVE